MGINNPKYLRKSLNCTNRQWALNPETLPCASSAFAYKWKRLQPPGTCSALDFPQLKPHTFALQPSPREGDLARQQGDLPVTEVPRGRLPLTLRASTGGVPDQMLLLSAAGALPINNLRSPFWLPSPLSPAEARLSLSTPQTKRSISVGFGLPSWHGVMVMPPSRDQSPQSSRMATLSPGGDGSISFSARGVVWWETRHPRGL